MPVPNAHIGTGTFTTQTDANGRFTIPAEAAGPVSVVAAGYHVVRAWEPADATIVLRPLEVRAVYLPYEQLWRQEALDWALDLARRGVISALVVDVKEEGGGVLPLVATATARDIGAVVDPGTDVPSFLQELEQLGIYRIARVVTFLDSRFAHAFPTAAIKTRGGRVLVDSLGLAWTNPFRDLARRYNIEIGVNAAAAFEEVQYDYVRLPANPGLSLHEGTTGAQRAAIIAQFAQEAAAALHAVGAALAVDTFGETTVIFEEDAIGQVLEELAPHIDYYSPMVYPSTWAPGWFGLAYPPAQPYTVVRNSVGSAVRRLAPFPSVVVRPWLQDFRDYQPQRLPYGRVEVLAQVQAAAEAGAQGFMLWDPGLNYQVGVLAELPGQTGGAGIP